MKIMEGEEGDELEGGDGEEEESEPITKADIPFIEEVNPFESDDEEIEDDEEYDDDEDDDFDGGDYGDDNE